MVIGLCSLFSEFSEIQEVELSPSGHQKNTRMPWNVLDAGRSTQKWKKGARRVTRHQGL